MSFADRYGFVGTEREVEEFNRNMAEIDATQRAVEQIDYIVRNHPERVIINGYNGVYSRADLQRIADYHEELEGIIPKGCSFAELNETYLPRYFAKMFELEERYKRKQIPINQRYSQRDYQKLMEYHRATMGRSVFDPSKILNGEELHLPDFMRRDETKNKRKEFLYSVANMSSNINKGALF